MFEFLLVQWKLRAIDVQYLEKKVAQGKITQEQMNEIIATEQISK